VRAGDAELTYADLQRRAGRLAAALRALGAGPECVAGVHLPRGLDLPVALLGVLGAGAAYLPLAVDGPRDRLLLQLAGVRASHLVTSQALRAALGDVPARVVLVDGEEAAGDPPPAAARLDNLAYVLHTSGSTGRPRPVAVTHRGLVDHARAFAALCGLGPDDRVLQFASIAFDVAAEELFPTWVAGAAVVMVEDPRLAPAAFERLLARDGVTVVNLPAGYFEHWARDLIEGGRRPPASLRLAVAGSDHTGSEIARRWLEHTGVPLVCAYGVTEATVTTTVHRVTPESAGEAHVPVGDALGGMEAVVLDGDLAPAPDGEHGELYLGGSGLARGYFGDPARTAERFLPRAGGGRLYRTGDLARRLPGGPLELLGRVDDQLKVRGQRVEPAEIVAALLDHPEVGEAHVALHRGDRPVLVAYLAPADPRRLPGETRLRAFLERRLPAAMLPDVFVVMDALPRTAGGKVDRRALPPPPAARTARAVPPRDDLERAVAAAWAEVLGLPEVGAEDGFLALGGNSLLALQAAGRLERELGVEVTIGDVLTQPTVAALAARLGPAAPGTAPGLPAVVREAPLSAAQEQVWFLGRLSIDSRAYHAQTTIRVAGGLDLTVLRRAVTELVARHEILRTTFEEAGGEPRQVVHDPEPAGVAYVDLRETPAAERAAAAEAVVDRELRRPFDLARLPLARWTVVQLDDEEFEVVLVEHHLVHDGWSFALLMRELSAIYTALARGVAPELPPASLQYRDYARWQRDALDSGALSAQFAYWTDRLAGAPATLALPTDRPRPPRQTFRGDMLRIEMPARLRGRLRELFRERGATLFMGLLAGFAGLLYRYTGEEDLCIGSAFANRRLRGTEGLLGMLVNTVVLRSDLSGDPSFGELLARTRRVVLEASANQELPFNRLVEAVNPVRDPAYNPLVQVMFSFDDTTLPAVELDGCGATVFERHNGTAKMDVNVIVEPRSERLVGAAGERVDDRLTLLWEYNADLFDAATMARMADHYQQLLEAAAAAPDVPLSRLSLLGPAEARRALEEWSAPLPAPPRDGLVADLVAAHARRAPDAVAVRAGTDVLSYGELDRRSVALAGALAGLGAGTETRVGLLAPRSPDLVAGALAVVRAGGAYVPLDPDQPAERLRFIAADAGVALVLADRDHFVAASGLGRPVLCLQDAQPPRLAPPPAGAAGPGQLVYVVYTSGSTGAPKGVMVEHGGLANLVEWHRRAFGLGPGDRVTLLAAPGFDASAWEIWSALAAGASLHVPDLDTRRSPERLRDWLVDAGITVGFLPTPLAEAVLALPWPASTALRTLLTGGDQLRTRPPADLPFAVVNNYGPTEDTVVSTSGPVEAAGPAALPSIGRPIAGARVFVLDPRFQPVPTGVPGELFVGGAGLARGYAGRPDLTAERFVPSPFGAGPGERLYRTGDLVRWLPDGEIDFLGRTDDQLEIRGQRVEPAEVVATLAAHPAVGQAHVLAAGDGDDRRLVAAVVPFDGRLPAAAELRAWCRERLPAYMVPAAVHVVDAVPLLPSGKVDRSALAALAVPAPEPAAGTGTEATIAGIWREVMGVDAVGPDDDFFEVGGHSLLAVKIATRLRAAFDVDVPLTLLFDHPTVSALARALDD
jgi:amino acid adenylation domain-containing protein